MTAQHVCSGELRFEGEIIPVAIKVMKCMDAPEVVERELEALAAVYGKPHLIQEVHPKFHHAGSDPAMIVTR